MASQFERQIQTYEDFECPVCGASEGHLCRVKSPDWTAERPLWRRCSAHEERVLAYRRAIAKRGEN